VSVQNRLLSDPQWNDRENSRLRDELDQAAVPYALQDEDALRSRLMGSATASELEFEQYERLMGDIQSEVRVRRTAGERGVSGSGARRQRNGKKSTTRGRPLMMESGEPLALVIEPILPARVSATDARAKLCTFAKRPHDELVASILAAKIYVESTRVKDGTRGAPRYYGGDGGPINVRIPKSVLTKVRGAADVARASWTHAVAAALAA
jgi:hypothetical protein